MSATCSSCGAPIEWVVGATGKRMPCDVEPVVADTRGLVRIGKDGAPVVLGAGRLLRSHFASCPHAAEHRKPS